MVAELVILEDQLVCMPVHHAERTGPARRPPAEPELLIRVHATDGTVLERRTRSWPAGWNRIAIDVDTWAGRSSVTAVEVGVRFVVPNPDTDTHTQAGAFTLGRIGWSAQRRTW